MSPDEPILIYCRWEAAGGVERVSLRLRDFLRRHGVAAELVCRGGGEVFGARALPVEDLRLRGRRLVFSRKSDLRDIGPRALTARPIYWRHIPVAGGPMRRILDHAFIAAMSRLGPVICVCDDLAAEMTALPLVRRASLRAMLSPVGADLPARVPIRRPDALRHLIHAGRPGGQKRLDRICAALTEARAAGQPVSLTAFGYPPDTPVPPGVTLAPPESDPRPALATADALVVWSDYEGFPTIMVEAALAGCPILANDFRTGRADFARLIGPVAPLGQEPDTLTRAFTRLPTGHYDLSGVRDKALWPLWQEALGLEKSVECRNPARSAPETAGLRVSDV
jgi:glycosyltransferase involved in cell wall biosynthesis